MTREILLLGMLQVSLASLAATSLPIRLDLRTQVQVVETNGVTLACNPSWADNADGVCLTVIDSSGCETVLTNAISEATVVWEPEDKGSYQVVQSFFRDGEEVSSPLVARYVVPSQATTEMPVALDLAQDNVRVVESPQAVLYDSSWYGDDSTELLLYDGTSLWSREMGAGRLTWTPTSAGNHTLSLYVGSTCREQTVFKVNGPELSIVAMDELGWGMHVGIEGNEPGWTVYYTLDGSIPDQGSLVYNEPIQLTFPKTVNAVAYSTNGIRSVVASTDFKYDVFWTVAFDANGGSCSETSRSVKHGVGLSSLPVPTLSHYASTGWYTETEGGERIAEGFLVNTNLSLYAHWIYVPACDDSLKVVADKLNGDTFSFSTALTLTAEDGCLIYYTQDGSEPSTNSIVYTSPIAINETTTVKYYEVKVDTRDWSAVESVLLTRVPTKDNSIVVTPSVADGTRFVGEQTVMLSAGEGETIWYTVDGSDPMDSMTRKQYTQPIKMTSDTTLKYYAVNCYGDYGLIQTASYVRRLADRGPYWELVDDVNWKFVIDDGYATVLGASNAVGAVVMPNALGKCPVMVVAKSAFRENIELTSVTIPASITNIGYWAFRDCPRLTEVTFVGNRPHLDLGAFEGTPVLNVISPRAGVLTAILPTDIKGDVVSIPETWFDQLATQHKGNVPAGYATYEEAFNAKFGSDHTKALVKETGKFDASGRAMQVWQDYVAGTDPLDEEDVFTATLTMEDGVPVVRWSPELTATQAALRTYKVYGSKSLSIDWVDVSELTDAERQAEGYQFFKVSVQMK